MRSLFWGVCVLAIAGAVMVWGLDAWTRSSAIYEREHAAGQALIIQAQGQARLDAAQASAITSAAMLPWAMVFCASILATVAVVYLMRQPAQQAAPPARIIERQVIFLPADFTRRDVFQVVSDAKPDVGHNIRAKLGGN